MKFFKRIFPEKTYNDPENPIFLSTIRLQWSSLLFALFLFIIGLAISFTAYNQLQQYRQIQVDEKIKAESRVLVREIEILRNIVDLFANTPLITDLNENIQLHQTASTLNFLKKIQNADSILDAYILDPKGICILSSNQSFMGKNYSFRPYFTDAVTNGTGIYFAFGVTSRQVGLYFSQRIEQGTAKGSIVVVKVDPLDMLKRAAKTHKISLYSQWHLSMPVTGFISNYGVLVSRERQGLLVLDSQILQEQALKDSLQFDTSIIQNIGLPPGTWNNLYKNKTTRVSFQQQSYQLFIKEVIPDHLFFFHSLPEGHHATSGIALLNRTILLLTGAFLLALISLVFFALSIERQRIRIKAMGDTLAKEKELKNENISRYQSVIEHGGQGFCTINPQTFAIESVNTTICDMLGVSADELIGKPVSDIVSLEDVPVLENSKRDNDHYTITVTLKGQGDSRIPVSIDSWLMRDRYDKALFRYSFISDLRENIQNLEKIRLLEAVVEQAASSIVITDIEGTIQYVNPAFSAVTGYSLDEAIGQNPSLLKTEQQSPEYYKEMWQILSSGSTWRGRFCNKTKDGSLYWEYAVIAPVRDDKEDISHFVAVKNDITEQVLLEEELQHKLTELELIVHHAGVGIAFVKDLIIVEINEAGAAIFNLPVVDLLSQSSKVLFDYDDNYQEFYQTLYPDLRAGKIVDFEYRKKGTDNKERWVQMIGRAVDSEAFIEKGIVWILQDVTDSHIYKQQLKMARKEAEESSIAKSRFLANMSHEIRTPMNAIIGMTRLTQETSLNEKQKKYVDRIATSSIMLLDILNDILDFSKIEAGQLLLENRPFLLVQLIDIVSSTMTGLAKEKGLSLSIDYADDIPEAFIGDATRLIQVLINLVGNAIKFTEQGSVTVTVNLKKIKPAAEILILSFSVKDTGIGIDPDQIGTLFQIFQQADNSISRRYGGTGLGLAISKQLVQLMGGEIVVDSMINIGSTFSFTVELEPCSAELVQQTCKKNAPDHGSLTTFKVLLVEDNEANRELCTIVLEQFKQRVYIAENGLLALEMLAEEHFDIIFMDVQMPEMDGITTTRVIRAMEQENASPVPLSERLCAKLHNRLACKHIQIIALTAHAMESDRNRCLDAGMNDYLTKPFKPEHVLAALQKLDNIENKTQEKNKGDRYQHERKKKQIKSITSITETVKRNLADTYGFNDEQVEKLLATASKSIIINLKKAEVNLLANELDLLASAAHALKGNLLNLGLTDLAAIAAKIEDAATTGEEQPYQQWLTAMRTELADLI